MSKGEGANIPTKLCTIVKRPDFEGYGFNLHSDKTKPGQYVGKIDSGSPAEEAGLKEGDRIIEVNGVPIRDETHKQVVQRIKAISCEVRLLLTSTDTNVDEDKVDANMKSEKIVANKSNHSGINIARANGASNGSKSSEMKMSDGSAHVSGFSKELKEISSQPVGHTDLPLHHTQQAAGNSDEKRRGDLMLPETAAEMRARLLSKKKFDPKNENVDLKKKFEIIQKL